MNFNIPLLLALADFDQNLKFYIFILVIKNHTF